MKEERQACSQLPETPTGTAIHHLLRSVCTQVTQCTAGTANHPFRSLFKHIPPVLNITLSAWGKARSSCFSAVLNLTRSQAFHKALGDNAVVSGSWNAKACLQVIAYPIIWSLSVLIVNCTIVHLAVGIHNTPSTRNLISNLKEMQVGQPLSLTP